MNRKLFLQIVLLLIISGFIIFLIMPKYYFKYKGSSVLRANKITGKIDVYYKGWQTLR
jgi:hypothetical protein